MFDPLEKPGHKAEPSNNVVPHSSLFSGESPLSLPHAGWQPTGGAQPGGVSPFDHFADAEDIASPSAARTPQKKVDPKKVDPKKVDPKKVDPKKPDPEAEKKKKTPEGLFPGVEDLTDTYGKLAEGPRGDTTDAVILHRTESVKAQSTLDGYKSNIKSGSHIGAQYLIDENGKPMLITGSDQRTSHVQNNNATSVGIEVAGGAQNLAPAQKAGTPQLREKIESLNLSPGYKERLLGYDDKELNRIVKDNTYKGDSAIYEDITGAQKRSVWNLTNNLAKKYDLDINDLSHAGKNESGDGNYQRGHLPDFSAHEHVQAKSMGEGEPMIEFMRERSAYPTMVANAEKKLAQMKASGATPEQMAQLQAMVSRESGTLSALNVDGTQKEIDAVKAEKDNGKPGEATQRESSRTDFYDHFYDRIGALKKALK